MMNQPPREVTTLERASTDTLKSYRTLKFKALEVTSAAATIIVVGIWDWQKGLCIFLLGNFVPALGIFIWHYLRAPYRLLNEEREANARRAAPPEVEFQPQTDFGPNAQVVVKNIGGSGELKASSQIAWVTGTYVEGRNFQEYIPPWIETNDLTTHMSRGDVRTLLLAAVEIEAISDQASEYFFRLFRATTGEAGVAEYTRISWQGDKAEIEVGVILTITSDQMSEPYWEPFIIQSRITPGSGRPPLRVHRPSKDELGMFDHALPADQ